MWKLAKTMHTSFFLGPLTFEYISFFHLVESWELCKFFELFTSTIFFFSSSYINTPYKLLSCINILNTSMSLNKTHLLISFSSSHHNPPLENRTKQNIKQRESIEIKIKILIIIVVAFSIAMLQLKHKTQSRTMD
ncbi:hypothetical protein AAZV13_09G101400 [Glycine max]